MKDKIHKMTNYLFYFEYFFSVLWFLTIFQFWCNIEDLVYHFIHHLIELYHRLSLGLNPLPQLFKFNKKLLQQLFQTNSWSFQSTVASRCRIKLRNSLLSWWHFDGYRRKFRLGWWQLDMIGFFVWTFGIMFCLIFIMIVNN